MTTDLVTKANNVELFRRASGDITFARFSVLNGVRYVLEKSGNNDVTRMSIDDFCRAFHGMACASNRKRTKPQLRRLIRMLIEDGQLALPEYSDDGQLVGIVYVQNIPDDDDEGIMEMVNECASRAKRQKDLNETKLLQLDSIIARYKGTR